MNFDYIYSIIFQNLTYFFRLVDATEGRILIDGVDISDLPLNLIRKNITIITQDPVLFSGSIKFNLDPLNIHNVYDLWVVLEKCHLKGFFMKQTGLLNFQLEDGGKNVSLGQRQLICLARAILRKTKILILDEATSSIDEATADLVNRTINEEFKHSTILEIVHRTIATQESDKIVVMESGKIIEYDSPQNLLQSESNYKKILEESKRCL